jgi:hypothetical protein
MEKQNQHIKIHDKIIINKNKNTYIKIHDNIIINENKNTYIKSDNNIIINEAAIRWIRKINNCLDVCTKVTGCESHDTHKICEYNNESSYKKLNIFLVNTTFLTMYCSSRSCFICIW